MAEEEFRDDGDRGSAAANAGLILLLLPLMDVRCARGVDSCISKPPHYRARKDWGGGKGRRAGERLELFSATKTKK